MRHSDWYDSVKVGDKLLVVDADNCTQLSAWHGKIVTVTGKRKDFYQLFTIKESTVNGKGYYAWRFEPVVDESSNETKPMKTMIPKTIAAATTEKAILEKQKEKLEASMLKTKLKLDAIATELHKVNTVLGL